MFLPDGLDFADIAEDTVPTTIVQAEDDGPAFVVNVRVLPIKEYRNIFAKITRGQEGGFRQNQAAQDRVDREYLNKVITSWSGLTPANWNAIVRDGRKVAISAETLAKSKAEKKAIVIEYSEDAAFYLYRNCWPASFGNRVFDVEQEGAEAAEKEEAEVKKA